MDGADPLLNELCSICHINPPKYRCPRCSTRTCSLPCTRRHKLWSQCSGVRDPAAYLKRSELASESAFDRDFNFITGIERTLERAEREVENRGIELARGQAISNEEAEDAQSSGAGHKRKHPNKGLVKGEAGFLRGAEAGHVKVLRAPRGMSRNKQNSSRWNPKYKCLSWTVEWVSATGTKTVRNALETYPISEAYDRALPRPKQERLGAESKNEKEIPKSDSSTNPNPTNTDTPAGAVPATTTTESPVSQLAILSDSETVEAPAGVPETKSSEETPELPIGPHHDIYFYLHRPRTTTKKPVLVPLPPQAKLAAILRERTVLEFPTIYALPDSKEAILASKDTSPFILEEEYLRTATPEELGEQSTDLEPEVTGAEDDESGVGLQNVDEKKVMEVLKQDLFETVS
ncbi:uncharacterized protein N7482_006833 [Penicillium canariense]|uniref:Box C/D snoRNA protein 1 n=1 Tax=Penicillium canariense TaxID=189055 RepID=A0A9W9LJI8_9EURO|nr:uncharacterized protein N7482_006833 [Penicillium canariense]KAJ5159829.1 hypothetical protein N7482_006833 [Penicillium canariense]